MKKKRKKKKKIQVQHPSNYKLHGFVVAVYVFDLYCPRKGNRSKRKDEINENCVSNAEICCQNLSEGLDKGKYEFYYLNYEEFRRVMQTRPTVYFSVFIWKLACALVFSDLQNTSANVLIVIM